jgi:hypothetical protein
MSGGLKRMAINEPRRANPEQDAIRQPLVELHSALMKLHKSFIDSDYIIY